MLTGYGAISEGTEERSCVDMILDKPATCNTLRETVARVMADPERELVGQPGDVLMLDSFLLAEH